MWTKCENNPEIMVTEITARQTWTQSREGDKAVGGAVGGVKRVVRHIFVGLV